jgi:hypothetical protein
LLRYDEQRPVTVVGCPNHVFAVDLDVEWCTFATGARSRLATVERIKDVNVAIIKTSIR